MPTYRSIQAVTTQARERLAGERIGSLLVHLAEFRVRWSVIRRLVDDFIEIDVAAPIPAEHLGHLGLQGPV